MTELPTSDIRDTGGNRPAVIFSHGTLLDRTMFDPQMRALGENYRSIAYTSRSGTSRYGTEQNLDDLVADCLDVADAATLEQFVLVGMSVGGFMAIELALKYPDRLAGLVLVSSMAAAYTAEERRAFGALLDPLDTDGPIPEDVIQAFVPVIFGPRTIADDSDLVQRWTAKWRRRPARSLWAEYRSWIDREDRVGRLSEIKIPTLVIHAEHDGGIDVKHGDVMAGELTNCTFVRVPDSGHLVTEEQPEIVSDAIHTFTDGLHPWGSPV
jgi:pimeloyl-ACP methyl ester carboxylesterase